MANWQDDPKAIEAIDYLIGIGVTADDFEAYYDEEYTEDDEDEEEDG